MSIFGNEPDVDPDVDADVDATDPVEDASPVEGYVEPEDGVTVRVPIGHRFIDPDADHPPVEAKGLKVTQEQAESLIEKSGGLVRLVETKED